MRPLAALFAPELPDDRDARWRLLNEFLGRWFPSVGGPTGTPVGDVDAAERRLTVNLPAGLREWYLRFGGLDSIWSHQDHLLPPSSLRVVDGVLVFCHENQSVVRWGLRVDKLNHDDPPVYVEDEDAEDGWSAEADSFSQFALIYAVMNAKWSDALACSANGPANRKALDAVRARYPRLPFPDQHWPRFPTQFRGNEDILLETHGDWLWVSALTEPAFDEVDANVKDAFMNWEHISCK